jgi:nucleoside-diphosphate-sugar epimerase
MKFTILGGAGFIGSALARHLKAQGHDVETPPRDALNLRGKNLGHVIYAIGLTGDFRARLRETVEAHVTLLQKFLEESVFDSWLYLSSARVYGGLPGNVVATEYAPVSVLPGADAVYDLSKLLGESICLAKDRPAVRVARLSNVYGAGQSEHTFLGSIIRDLRQKGNVVIGESADSGKDYVSLDDVVSLLEKIALQGCARLYNVASGHIVTHGQLADAIHCCGFKAEFAEDAPTRRFPPIDTARIAREFGWKPRSVLADLPSLVRLNKSASAK